MGRSCLLAALLTLPLASWGFLPPLQPPSQAFVAKSSIPGVLLQAKKGGFSGKGGKKSPGSGGGGKPKTLRERQIDDVGSARLRLDRTDFPPVPELIFPSSEDYLWTLNVVIAGRNRSFTVDTTASVNLVTAEVAEDIERATGPGGKKGNIGGKGFMVDEGPLLETDDTIITVDMLLPSEPRVAVSTRAVVAEQWAGAGDGCLGLPFLRKFGVIDIDLKTLATTLTGTGAVAKEMVAAGDLGSDRQWTVDFAPLSAMAGMEDEDDEVPEVWVVDAHLDGSNETIPAIIDIGSQASYLNWKAGRALGYRIKDAKSVEDEAGQGRVDVIFTEPTDLSLGQRSRVVVPKRSFAVVDLPVFEYAGLAGAPAMVLGLDVLGAGKRLMLDYLGKELSLGGPLHPPKLRQAEMELPLVMQESISGEGEEVPPFGLPRQYGVPVGLGENVEALFMLDTASVGTIITREAWEIYESQKEQAEAEGEGEGGEEEEEEDQKERPIPMSGTGGKLDATQVILDLILGATDEREGHPVTSECAVVDGITTAFDGVLGLSLFQYFGVADFDFRHQMLRMYARSDSEDSLPEGGGQEPVLDYWPPPGDKPLLPIPLAQGLDAPGIYGADYFLHIEVFLGGKTQAPIIGLLDTGGQTSVLNRAAAEALGVFDDVVQQSEFKAYGLDQRPIPLEYAYFDDIRLGPQQVPGCNLAIADLPGLAKVGLLDKPAMLVGMDLLDGGRHGRVVLDMERKRMYITQ